MIGYLFSNQKQSISKITKGNVIVLERNEKVNEWIIFENKNTLIDSIRMKLEEIESRLMHEIPRNNICTKSIAILDINKMIDLFYFEVKSANDKTLTLFDISSYVRSFIFNYLKTSYILREVYMQILRQ